jgi:phospholipid/cholesterol/gamma-HCH transport system substrate-binding protein
MKTETLVGLFIIFALGAFVYLTIHVGVLRFDHNKYYPYIGYFKDVTGLTRKADVKISGVKVGWVDSIDLDNQNNVRVYLMISKEQQLHAGSYSILRRDGFIGNKYIEVVDGSFSAPVLPSGSALGKTPYNQVDIDQLLLGFKDVSSNIKQLTNSLKDSLGNEQGSQDLKEIIQSFKHAVSSIGKTSDDTQHLIKANQEHITQAVADLKDLVNTLKHKSPEVANNINHVADHLDKDFLPSIKQTAHTAGTDFSQTTSNANELIDQIKTGRGIAGKLISDELFARRVQNTTDSLCNVCDYLTCARFAFDSRLELYSRKDGDKKRDVKFHLNGYFFPTPCQFLLLGTTFSQRGYAQTMGYQYLTPPIDNFSESSCPTPAICPTPQGKSCTMNVDGYKKFKCNRFSLNLQCGTVYNNVALRLGIFQGSFGLGVDCNIPIDTCGLHWWSTFEVFDFNGYNRFSRCNYKDNLRPHLKWLNRLFIGDDSYIAFGINDFAHRTNRNGFVGIGYLYGG